MQRVTKSLKIDPNLWIDIKVHCAKAQIDISEFIESLVRKELKKNR